MSHPHTIVCPKCGSRPWEPCPHLPRYQTVQSRDLERRDLLLHCTRHRIMIAKRVLAQ